MKCNSCQFENSSDSEFCFNCGAPLNNEEILSKKSPKNKKKIISISIILLVLILFIASIIFVFLPKIKRSIMGETQYYLYKESKIVEQALNFEGIKELRHPNTYTASSNIKMECYDVDGKSSQDEDITALFNYLNSLNADIKVSHDKENKKVYFDGTLKTDDEEIAHPTLKYNNHKIIIEDENEYSIFDFRQFYDLVSSGENDSKSSKTNSLNAKDNSLLNSLNDVCNTDINDRYITQVEREEFDGKKYDCVKYEFNNSDIAKICIKMLKVIAKDENFASFIAAADANELVVDFLYEMDIISSDSLDLKSFMSDLYDTISTLKEQNQTYEYKIFYDWRGNVAIRTLTIKNSENSYKTEIKTDVDKSNLSVDVDFYEWSEGNWNDYVVAKYTKSDRDEKSDLTFDYTLKDGECPYGINVKVDDFGVSQLNGINVLLGDAEAIFKYDGYYQKYILSATDSGTYDIMFKLQLVDSSDDMNYVFNANINSDISNKADIPNIDEAKEYNSDYEDFFDEMIGNWATEFYDAYDEFYSDAEYY